MSSATKRGYASRRSSSVAPSASLRSRSSTGIRVARITGFPCRISGLISTRSVIFLAPPSSLRVSGTNPLAEYPQPCLSSNLGGHCRLNRLGVLLGKRHLVNDDGHQRRAHRQGCASVKLDGPTAGLFKQGGRNSTCQNRSDRLGGVEKAVVGSGVLRSEDICLGRGVQSVELTPSEIDQRHANDEIRSAHFPDGHDAGQEDGLQGEGQEHCLRAADVVGNPAPEYTASPIRYRTHRKGEG